MLQKNWNDLPIYSLTILATPYNSNQDVWFSPHHSNRLSTKILRIALHAKPRKAQHWKGQNQ